MDLKTKSMREAKKFFEDFQGVELTGITFHSHDKILEASQSDLWDLMDSYLEHMVSKCMEVHDHENKTYYLVPKKRR